MRRPLVLIVLIACMSGSAFAQTTPFDMSPERPAGQQPQPVPRLVQPTPPPVPRQVSPSPIAPVRPTLALPPPSQVTPPLTQAAAPVTGTGSDPRRRYILPFTDLNLSGEMDQRQWTVYLTPEQAQTAVSLNIAYQNAIVVAPESSNIEATINNVVLDPKSIASPDGESTVIVPIPPGTLQAGANTMTLAVRQRHRTDCTIQSTYDLWTDINPAETYIAFSADVGGRFGSIDDIQATGPDGKGLTNIEIIVPGLGNPAFADSLLRLSQALALRTQMPNQTISFHTTLPSERDAGTLTVLVGTSREIASVTRAVPPEALAGAFAGFEDDIIAGASALIISGPTPQAVQSAIASMSDSVERPVGTVRATLSTKAWHTPDAPLIMSDRRILLSTLGLKSSEFSGRRFRTEFMIGVPADFYASAYGEAILLLDAAYSAEVMPGSHIDVYVNGNIASTVPVSNNGGGIFRHLPINVTMRHFVPGVNTITIEAVLMTQADSACLPGAVAGQNPRFALFDTSEFHMPDFAKIGRTPDLAATSGLGQPYRAGGDPVAVSLERVDADTMSTAATLLGKLALAAGHLVAVETVSSPAAVGDRHALFIGTLSQMPQSLISQLDLAPTSQVTWKDGQDGSNPTQQTEQLFEDWRQKVDGGLWQGQISSLEEWMTRNFDISSDTLRFLPGSEQPYTPSPNISFMLAQGLSPNGEGVWTIATAPTSADMRSGMAAMAEQKKWTALSGRVAAYDAKAGEFETIIAEQPRFVSTRPWSFWNARLIAANWLSTNILSYSLVFVGFLSLLGGVTFLMLRSMGRHK